jgi:nucleotide-binding universal stress UspA family protein
MRVLLPVNGNEERAIAAAESVKTLCNKPESIRVILLNVRHKIDVRSSAGYVSSEEFYDEEDYPSSLEKASEVLSSVGVTAEKRREHGDPAEVIVEVADEVDANWIILAARRKTPVGKVLFGSVAQSVLLNADVPIVVVPR